MSFVIVILLPQMFRIWYSLNEIIWYSQGWMHNFATLYMSTKELFVFKLLSSYYFNAETKVFVELLICLEVVWNETWIKF